MGRRSLLLCFSSGLLLALSFPPLRTGFLAYVGLVPLLFLLDHDHRTSAVLKYGCLTGFFFSLGSLYWIAWDTEPGLFVIVPATVAVALILSLYSMLFAFCFAFLRWRVGQCALLAVPFLWTAIEYLRSLGALAFPWTSLAYTQTYYLPFIQFASFTSAYGVSFWVIALNVALYLWIKKGLRRRYSALILMVLGALFFFPYVHGQKVMSERTTNSVLRAALIQGNVDPRVKWDERYRGHNVDVYVRMTERGVDERVELVIWPETALPVHVAHEKEYRRTVQNLADSLDVPILTGAPHYTFHQKEGYLFHNSAFLFTPGDERLREYSKIHLVPFSERMPFKRIFPFLDRFNFGQADFSPGTEYTLFEIGEGRFAVLICFESIFPELVREFVRRGADFLVVITNDAWFGKTSSPYQHARIAIFRAIENRIGLARCANTGVSMFVDPFGRVTKETELFTRTAVCGEVSFADGETFYTRHGNVFSQACVLVSAGWLLLSLLFRRRPFDEQWGPHSTG